ncbi:EamA family transporter [Crenobacter sp. SG2303]|uniref:EamA family transporter n=1 Tax=Crenobacter oryzisoli TaxID=3056844 RepID=A0ABT7XSQ4_9NEIS|nr:EamA family transporter [Crenobacter sp. SG2303]MDN0076748.1 EamA family transporter [Crenobacter sp. SG2303]
MSPVKHKLFAMLCVLTSAMVWGFIWYPFRAMHEMGISNFATSMLVYLGAAAAGLTLFYKVFRDEFRFQPVLIPLTIAFGWCNFSYTWSVTEGEVMRVLLLFYLSPLWAVFFSWVLLKERLTRTGWGVVALSLVGCAVILYKPGAIGNDAPLSHGYEWLALSGGFAFAFGNVLSRRAKTLPVAAKSACIWFGVASMGFIGLVSRGQLGEVAAMPAVGWALVVAMAMSLFATSVVSQYGLTILPATQAMTLMLMELVFAALSAYLLAGEVMKPNEWLGGALIVGASLMSGKMTHKPAAAQTPAAEPSA